MVPYITTITWGGSSTIFHNHAIFYNDFWSSSRGHKQRSLGEGRYTKTCIEHIWNQRSILTGFMGLTRRADDWPDGWHRDGCRWDWYQRVRMPAPVALLGRPRVHGRGYWNKAQKMMWMRKIEQNKEICVKTYIVLLNIHDFSFASTVKDLPGLSPKSAVRYPWLWGPKETWEGLSKGGRPSTPRPLGGPFTLRAVGTGDTQMCT